MRMNLNHDEYSEIRMLIVYAMMTGYFANDTTKLLADKFDIQAMLDEVASKLDLLV